MVTDDARTHRQGTGAQRARLAALRSRRDLSGLSALFPNCPRGQLFDTNTPWPQLCGCLVILFASRSGSTFLCRELEQIYEIGELGESLNPPQLRARALRIEEEYPSSALRYTIRHLMENGWFGFKAGNQAIVIAEKIGFVSEYLQKTSF